MNLTNVDRVLWALSLAGHAILLFVLLFRRRASSFPIFTTLIATNILRTLILYAVVQWGAPGPYFYAYWTMAIVDVALQLGITYEVATHVFQPLGVWAADVRKSFSFILSCSVLIAIVLSWLATPTSRTLRQAVVIRGEFFSSALLSELFVAMVALSVTMGLPWRSHVARLAQGLGLYSLFGIVTNAAYSFLVSGRTNVAYKSISHLQMGLYLGVLTYWTVALAMPEPEARRMPEQLHRELCALQVRATMTLRSLRATRSA